MKVITEDGDLTAEITLKEVGRRLLVERLFVPEEMRGKGVATELIQKASVAAVARGKTVRVDLQGPFEEGVDMARLEALFLRTGFVRHGSRLDRL